MVLNAPTCVLALDESPLKAAIVYNLLLFVQWPDEDRMGPNSALTLCADAGGALWPHLRALQSRPVRRFRLELRELGPDDGSAAQLCHATLLEDRPARRSAALSGLTIGDGRRADEPGIVIALRPVNGRVGFDIDLSAARAHGLSFSSKVLRLARVVRE
jgi:hypothetical protein